MISQSSVDPSARRRGGLVNMLPKKSSIHPSSINTNEHNGTKKKGKKRTKSLKKKRSQYINTNNNNNNNDFVDDSFMSLTSDYDIYLPQIGYS